MRIFIHNVSFPATSDASTKSETVHMYGGTNGTASSPSVNSSGSFSRGDSMEECAVCVTETMTATLFALC